MTDEPHTKTVIEIQSVEKRVLKHVWAKMRAGTALEGSEVYIGRSMAEHPMWFPLFETLGLLEGDDELPDGTNPYVHLTFHMLVGAQIFHQQPPQATQFYKKRLTKGDDSHSIAHMMIDVFKKQLFLTAQRGLAPEDFDLKKYGRTLQSLQNLPKAKVWAKLGYESDPSHHEA